MCEKKKIEDNINKLKNEFTELYNIKCKIDVMSPGAEHKPSKLINATKGVYIFFFNDICLKVGKSGPNSQARWKYQHYNQSGAQSNLANSLLSVEDLSKKLNVNINEIESLNSNDIKQWIINNLFRVEVIIENVEEDFSVNLLEAFLLFKLKPIFEGNKQ